MSMPPEKWIPVLAERTATIADQVLVLWQVIKHELDLPESLRDEIQDRWFTYQCGYSRAESRKLAEKQGRLEEYDQALRDAWDHRLAEIQVLLDGAYDRYVQETLPGLENL